MAKRENRASHHGKHEERRRQAWSLYLAGETSRRAIGRAIGVSHTTVCKYLTGILAEIHEETVARAREARDLELARLDTQLKRIWPQVLAGNVRANEVALKISAARRSLLGLDAPQRIEKVGPDGRPPIEYIEVRLAPAPAKGRPGYEAFIESQERDHGRA